MHKISAYHDREVHTPLIASYIEILCVFIIIIIIISLFKEKGSTKGSRPVQGASLTHTQITITYIQVQYKIKHSYNIHTRTITKGIHRN